MTLDSSKLAQTVLGGLSMIAVGFIWNAHARLATIEARLAGADVAAFEARLAGAEDVLDGVITTFDVLHPRGSALMGGPSERAEGMKARLERIQKRAPEPEATQPGDDDDSASDDDDSAAP